MKRNLLAMAAAVISLILLTGAAFGETFVVIGSGGVGGTYYPLGGIMAEVLTKAGIDVRASSRSTAASKENCRLVASGRIQIGMSMGSTLYQAYTGTDAFAEDGKLPLATLMHMYPAPHHLVTLAGSGITKLDDIRGRTVSLGAPGGGDLVLTEMILKAAGIDPEKDLRSQKLTQPEGVTALKDGNIDAVFWNFSAPGSAVMEVAAVRNIVLIPLPKELVNKIVADNPFMFPYKIPAKTYGDEQAEDVLTIADGNFLVVNEKIDDKLAYGLVKAIVENRDAFMKVTTQAEHFVPEESSIGIIPFAKGAAAYFKEQGIEVE